MSSEGKERFRKIRVYVEPLEVFEESWAVIPLQSAFLRLLERIPVGHSFEITSWSDYWAVRRACKLSGYKVKAKIRTCRDGKFRVFRVL